MWYFCFMENLDDKSYDPAEAFGDDLIEAAQGGRDGLRAAELQYGRMILAVAEEVGGIPERDTQFATIRRGPIWLATSINALDRNYPGAAAAISERYRLQRDAEQ
jgi:hypothetical protein